MGTPGTYRASDGSRVEFAAALAAWTAAAVPVLERVARTYHATISYKELGEEVQQVTGIRTRVLLMNWIGQVLGGVSRISHRRGQPMLSALCVHADGTVGDGYGQAILDNYGGPLPDDLDMHAAEERLRCHRSFGADLPPGGGRPALTPQVPRAGPGWPASQEQTLRAACARHAAWHSRFQGSAITAASHRQPPGATARPAASKLAPVT
jgi:hypothetical protein